MHLQEHAFSSMIKSPNGGENPSLFVLILIGMCGRQLNGELVSVRIVESNETQDCSNKTVDPSLVQKINVSDIYN